MSLLEIRRLDRPNTPADLARVAGAGHGGGADPGRRPSTPIDHPGVAEGA